MIETKTLALVGCDAPTAVISSLGQLGFEVVLLPCDERLQIPVRSHADMLLCVIDKDIFCSSQYFFANRDIFEGIEALGYSIHPCDAEISKDYPKDIAFNLLYTNKHVLGKTDFSAKEVLLFAKERGIQTVTVKQGYAKCSTLLLSDLGAISADDGILKEAKKIGLETLKTENSPEAVTLSGYSYGFIGGASGVFNRTVYFTGNISLHPNAKEIIDFCNRLGFDTVALTEERLCDVGGIIFLPSLL